MYKIAFACLFFSQITFCQNNTNTKKIEASSTLHGTTITDNYSWLENIKSTEVRNWVKEQNNLSQLHLKEITDKYNAQTSSYYAAARLWVDEIIDPVETRRVISEGLNAANHNPDIKEFKTGVFQV